MISRTSMGTDASKACQRLQIISKNENDIGNVTAQHHSNIKEAHLPNSVAQQNIKQETALYYPYRPPCWGGIKRRLISNPCQKAIFPGASYAMGEM